MVIPRFGSVILGGLHTGTVWEPNWLRWFHGLIICNQVPRPLLAMINLWQSSNICVFCSEWQGEINALIMERGGREMMAFHVTLFYLQLLA